MTRPFVLGIDCRLYMMPVATRDPAAFKPEQWDGTPGTGPPLTNPFKDIALSTMAEIKTVQDVTLNLTASTADVTSRNSNGWRQMVSVLKDGSVDFSVIWQPDDALFADLLQYFLDQCPGTFAILDGPIDGDFTGTPEAGDAGRCGDTGLTTGLFADFIISDFTRNESLEEGLTADVSIQPALGVIFPEWIEIVDTTP